MKTQSIRTVFVQGKGNTKTDAFADALMGIRKAVMVNAGEVLLRIEPENVTLVKAKQYITKEAFLFFFFKRERVQFSVELEVVVKVLAIETQAVVFETHNP
jgi:uncharacterized protein (TIGR03578 family)